MHTSGSIRLDGRLVEHRPIQLRCDGFARRADSSRSGSVDILCVRWWTAEGQTITASSGQLAASIFGTTPLVPGKSSFFAESLRRVLPNGSWLSPLRQRGSSASLPMVLPLPILSLTAVCPRSCLLSFPVGVADAQLRSTGSLDPQSSGSAKEAEKKTTKTNDSEEKAEREREPDHARESEVAWDVGLCAISSPSSHQRRAILLCQSWLASSPNGKQQRCKCQRAKMPECLGSRRPHLSQILRDSVTYILFARIKVSHRKKWIGAILSFTISDVQLRPFCGQARLARSRSDHTAIAADASSSMSGVSSYLLPPPAVPAPFRVACPLPSLSGRRTAAAEAEAR